MPNYTVHCDPLTHLYSVTLTLTVSAPSVDLSLPVWTPGSYLVREYSRHLQGFSCGLPWQKINKNTWRIQVPESETSITVTYQIYAYELTVRTSHLDTSHGYFNGACLFLYHQPSRYLPHHLEIVPPQSDWQITTSLQPFGNNCYRAQTYDELVDSPVEIGTHSIYNFTVLGKPHRLAIWGQGNYQPEKLVQDITQIIETTAPLFGGLPYEEYLFLVHCADSYGGLEHCNSTTLLYPRNNFQPAEQYERFLQLVAHEFFHTWNIKRLRPVTLDRFDYTQESYVSVLWFCEGATAYYDEYLCWRAGFYDTKRYLTLLSEAITRLETTLGKDIQSLTQSSFDAWIKLYRPDENSLNSSISYYLKGHIVIWLLNLHLIAQGRGSFDRVMQLLWQKFQHQPYTESELWATIEECADEDLTSFYKDYISGTTTLPYAEMLTPLGLSLTEELSPFPYTGLRIGEDKPILRAVDSNSPAQQAGLAPGDELVALNGWRVLPRAKDLFKSCEAVQVSFFRREELLQTTLTPTSPRPARYVLTSLLQRSPQQEANYQAWVNPQ